MSALPAFTTLGGGPTVLMLHGIGGGHLAFAPQVESFASSGYRAVAWDMPGYGRSAPIEPYTFKGLAQSCQVLIEAQLIDVQLSDQFRFGVDWVKLRDNVAGVIGGIAQRFGWNSTLLRVVYIIVSIASVAFPGILVYLILWLLMPEEGG